MLTLHLTKTSLWNPSSKHANRPKKRNIVQQPKASRASFTPIIASCEAIFDCEAEVYFLIGDHFIKEMGLLILPCTFLYQGKNANMYNDISKFMHLRISNKMEGSRNCWLCSHPIKCFQQWWIIRCLLIVCSISIFMLEICSIVHIRSLVWRSFCVKF